MLWNYWFPNHEYKLVMVGLDNAGKTTTLYRLTLGQAVVTGPTVGSNVEQLEFENMTFEVHHGSQYMYATLTQRPQIWDLGGQSNLRPSWATYYRHTDAVIMVVDSTDKARVGTAKVRPSHHMLSKHYMTLHCPTLHCITCRQEELFRLLDHESLAKTPVLVLANKQDLRTAMSVAELSESLALHSIKKHDWHIQGCCALTGQGLLDGVSWIAQRVNPSGGGPTPAPQPPKGPRGPPAQPVSTSASVVPATSPSRRAPG